MARDLEELLMLTPSHQESSQLQELSHQLDHQELQVVLDPTVEPLEDPSLDQLEDSQAHIRPLPQDSVQSILPQELQLVSHPLDLEIQQLGSVLPLHMEESSEHPSEDQLEELDSVEFPQSQAMEVLASSPEPLESDQDTQVLGSEDSTEQSTSIQFPLESNPDQVLSQPLAQPESDFDSNKNRITI